MHYLASHHACDKQRGKRGPYTHALRFSLFSRLPGDAADMMAVESWGDLENTGNSHDVTRQGT